MISRIIIFIVSFSTLSFEVLLIRLFSITQWNHLSFMVISIALFGFTMSGIFINIIGTKNSNFNFIIHLKKILFLFSFSLIISFLYINNAPLDFFKLSTDLMQLFFLILSFIILSIPFFASGLITGLAFSTSPEKSGSIYFAAMFGSASGAIFPLIAMIFISVESVILLSICIPLMLIFFDKVPKANGLIKVFSIVLIIIFSILYFFNSKAIIIEPSPYKLLSQYRQIPGLEIINNFDTPKARITHVKSPYIRYAPGLSLKFTGLLPEQSAVITDGDSSTVLYHNENKAPEDNFIYYTLPYIAYNLLASKHSTDTNDILIIQKGGGTGLYSAINTKVIDNITLLEEVPYIAEIINKHYTNADLNIFTDNVRTFLSGSNSFYDLIQIENWGSSLPGMISLNEEYLFTKEAVISYLGHLSNNGILVISRNILMPPSDSLKLISTINQAFLETGYSSINNNIAVLRSWDCFTILVFKSQITENELNTVIDFTEKYNFDTVYYPGITIENVNRFNQFEHPFYYLTVNMLLSNMSEDFTNDYTLNISSSNDNMPYHNSYLKWNRIGELIEDSGNRLFSIILSGEIILAFIFISALLICILLLLIPLIITARKTTKFVMFFLFIGFGFMFMEMAYLKKYTFLYGDPVLAFGIVLAVLLLFSGLGGKLSDLLKIKNLKYVLSIIIILSMIFFFCMDILMNFLITLNTPVRTIFSVLILSIVSFFMGFPFPMAIRLLLKNPSEIAYGWAANGGTSVLTSIISVFIAMNLGISVLFLFCAVSYIIAFLSIICYKS